MKEKCLICKSIINEIKLFNGEDKYFCSLECVRKDEYLQRFREKVQRLIDKYQHTSEDELINLYTPEYSDKEIKSLVFEMINRDYFIMGKYKFIYQKGKTIEIPLKKK